MSSLVFLSFLVNWNRIQLLKIVWVVERLQQRNIAFNQFMSQEVFLRLGWCSIGYLLYIFRITESKQNIQQVWSYGNTQKKYPIKVKPSTPLRPLVAEKSIPQALPQSCAGVWRKDKRNKQASCLLFSARLCADEVVIELSEVLPTTTAPCLVSWALVFGLSIAVFKLGQYNKANAADCQSKVFLVADVARQVVSRFDNLCWQTTDSRRDVLCRVESYGNGFASSALMGGVGRQRDRLVFHWGMCN